MVMCSQIQDVAVVWTLLGVFVLAWAISSQALLYDKESQFNLDTLQTMLMRSYWPMFGQYNFNEFANSMYLSNFLHGYLSNWLYVHTYTYTVRILMHSDLTITYPNGTTDVLNVSPVAQYLLPFMLAVFMVFTVLILFNLVIAMFKYDLWYFSYFFIRVCFMALLMIFLFLFVFSVFI